LELSETNEIKINNFNVTSNPITIPISQKSKIQVNPSPSLKSKLSYSPSLNEFSKKNTHSNNFSLHNRTPSSHFINSNTNSPSLLPVYIPNQNLNHKVSSTNNNFILHSRRPSSSLSIRSNTNSPSLLPVYVPNQKLNHKISNSNNNFSIHSRRPSSSLSNNSIINSPSLLPVYVPSQKLNHKISNSSDRTYNSSLSVDSLPSSPRISTNKKLNHISVDSIPTLNISSNNKKLHRLSVDSIITTSGYKPAKMISKYPPPAPSSYSSCRQVIYQSMNENEINPFNHKASFNNDGKGNGYTSPQIHNQKISLNNSMIPRSPKFLNKRHSRTFSSSSNSSISSLLLPPSSIPHVPSMNSNIINNHNRKKSSSSIPIPSPKLTNITSNAFSPSSPFHNNYCMTSSPKISYSLPKARFYKNKNYSTTDISYSNGKNKIHSFTNNYKNNSESSEDQFNTSTLLQYKDDILKKNYKNAPSISSVNSYGSPTSLELKEMMKKYDKREIREKEKYYLEWIKECLEEYGEEDIYIDIENDRLSNILSDGIILAYLIEYLSNRSVGDIYHNPKIRQDKYYNLKKVFDLIKDELFVPAKATEYDIECGDLSAILSLLRQLKNHYHRMDLKEYI
jgi:hypothetical protein